MQIINHYTPNAMKKAYIMSIVSTDVLFLQENYKNADNFIIIKKKRINNTHSTELYFTSILYVYIYTKST